jgi:hypothetical protein
MRVETVGNIVCAVNTTISRCKIKTCQHTFMTRPQLKEYKSKVYAEFQRKKDLKPKYPRPQSID